MSDFTQTSESEPVSMSDVVDKINLSSRFFEDKIERCVDLLFVSHSEFNFEFKLLVILIGPGVVYFF